MFETAGVGESINLYGGEDMNEILLDELKDIQENPAYEDAAYGFLCAYYDCYINSIVEEDIFPEELVLPLEERPSGVCEGMEWLVKNGCDLNEGSCNALMMAVAFADAPMTSFLIKHGADAN